MYFQIKLEVFPDKTGNGLKFYIELGQIYQNQQSAHTGFHHKNFDFQIKLEVSFYITDSIKNLKISVEIWSLDINTI
jgi:hypothetical protein